MAASLNPAPCISDEATAKDQFGISPNKRIRSTIHQISAKILDVRK